MIIERDLTSYVVYSGDPVLRALEKITANKARVIFLVDAHGHLDGVLSDGDFRRWVSSATTLSTDVPALEAANTSPRSLSIGSTPLEMRASTTSRSSTSAATSSPSRSTAATSSTSGATWSPPTPPRW